MKLFISVFTINSYINYINIPNNIDIRAYAILLFNQYNFNSEFIN